MTNSWRNPPSIASEEQLAAVNELLQSIGQAPVSTLDTSNPDVSIAWNTLVSTNRDVQAEGWTFNKEYRMVAKRSTSPDTLNYILIADNELQVDLTKDELKNKYHDSVMRSTMQDGKVMRFLYDRFQHTSEWDFDPYVDKVFLFPWEDVPIPIKSYIVAKAAAEVSIRITGDSSQYQMLKQREDYNREQALEYECTQGDYSMLNLNQATSTYLTYRSNQALSRY